MAWATFHLFFPCLREKKNAYCFFALVSSKWHKLDVLILLSLNVIWLIWSWNRKYSVTLNFRPGQNTRWMNKAWNETTYLRNYVITVLLTSFSVHSSIIFFLPIMTSASTVISLGISANGTRSFQACRPLKHWPYQKYCSRLLINFSTLPEWIQKRRCVHPDSNILILPTV